MFSLNVGPSLLPHLGVPRDLRLVLPPFVLFGGHITPVGQHKFAEVAELNGQEARVQNGVVKHTLAQKSDLDGTGVSGQNNNGTDRSVYDTDQ